jgi:hypothetical protein
MPPIRDWLRADPTVSGLLTTSRGFWVFQDEVPQDWKQAESNAPSVVYSLVSGVPNNHLDCPPSIEYQRIQFDVWAYQQSLSQQVFVAVRAVLEAYGYTVTNFTERDPDTRNWRVSFDFTNWLNR